MPLPERLANARIPEEVLAVLTRLHARGFAAYLVGGCVRDLLRGAVPKDFDVATSALPAEVKASFPKVIPTGVEHGTVTVLSRGEPVEVTTFRTESEYLDARRPSKVEFHGEIEGDLARRDFTINAMALDPEAGELVDPFGGQADLEARVVRCVRDPLERFGEDGLRPMRAVRIATVLEFSLDPATEAAIPQTLGVFARVAVERVNQELGKLLLSRAPARGLHLLASTGLLGGFLPERAPLPEPISAQVERAPADLPLRLAALLDGLATPADLLARLKFPNRTVDEVALLLGAPPPPPSASDVELRRWMARLGTPEVPRALLLEKARAPGEAAAALERRCQALLAAAPPLSPREVALQGKQIMAALGVGPSPIVGDASRYLFDRVLEDPSLNQPGPLTELLRKWSKEKGV